jgi:DNA-binding transcriptional regulator YdaS (Cro superfamily)
MDNALKTAIREAGSISELGRRLGISQQAISQWKRVPLDWVLAVEKATNGKVPAHKLRPEMYRDYKRVREMEPA